MADDAPDRPELNDAGSSAHLSVVQEMLPDVSELHVAANDETRGANPPPTLPDGWVAGVDLSDGRVYYFDRINQCSQWEVPTAPAVAQPLPDGWEARYDTHGRKYHFDLVNQCSQWEVPTQNATIISEPARARRADLELLGHLIASQLAAGCTADSGFERLWRTRVVPLAVEAGCDWALGATARLCGLTSANGQKMNGRVGRLLCRTDAGRWEVLVRISPRDVVNLKPENLAAARREDVLYAWRQLPLGAHERVRGMARAMRAADGPAPLPVTILSGFLGAGKSSRPRLERGLCR